MISLELLEILAPAAVASLAIALTHAPLGIEVLRRGIIFIDLAIAQIAGLGVVAANLYWPDANWLWVQGAALTCALVAALAFRWVERHIHAEQEAIIGCGFIVAASLTLLLMADHPHGGEEITHLLSGQILFVTWQDVLGHVPIYLTILLVWFMWPQVRAGSGFFVLFALAITSSVQLVGVYVVFASLILPALVAARYPNARLKAAWISAVLALVAGLTFATLMDYPAGPVLVVSYALVAVLAITGRQVMARMSSI